jgi:hypothetical protein
MPLPASRPAVTIAAMAPANLLVGFMYDAPSG